MRGKVMGNERGVTLIALIATVGIMIILAAVTLNMALIDNNAVVREVLNETEKQQQMVREEERKRNSVISSYEEEWGLW